MYAALSQRRETQRQAQQHCRLKSASQLEQTLLKLCVHCVVDKLSVQSLAPCVTVGVSGVSESDQNQSRQGQQGENKRRIQSVVSNH